MGFRMRGGRGLGSRVQGLEGMICVGFRLKSCQD